MSIDVAKAVELASRISAKAEDTLANVDARCAS